ncbi:MAG TPA: hypothetical protein VMI11_03175 [Actinomycetes bacterium]|nr:hypothetical protein [Actinomycetes bacterium]
MDRDELFREQAAAQARREARESDQARALLAGFVREARARGIAPGPLRARSYRGRTTYDTGLVGWYLPRDRSLAVDTEGRFYVLNTPGGLLARVRGVTVVPSDPPLQIGRGARDGESMPLTELLEMRLAGGDEWA